MQANPIIVKELKTKMRGWKSPALLTSYLAFMALISLFYFITEGQFSSRGSGYFNPRMALNGYKLLASIQFFLIVVITPALTSNAISGERERQTLDLLLCTNLSPFSIIAGKVVVSIAHIILLITASLPLMGMVFLFGGVTPGDLLLLFAFYLITAFMVGCMGIFFSTVFKKSSISMVASYIMLGVLTVGTIIALVFWRYIIDDLNNPPTAMESLVFMTPNFLFGFFSIIEFPNNSFLGIFSGLTDVMRQAGWNLFIKNPWIINVIFNIAASAVFLLLASRRVKPLKDRIFKRGRQQRVEALKGNGG